VELLFAQGGQPAMPSFTPLQMLNSVVGLAAFVMFILVVVQMFKHDQTALGIVSLVLCLCGIGQLIAFVVGWINVGKWNIRPIMLIWTGLIVVYFLIYFIDPPQLPKFGQ
jgi:hypothetical protein